ncbi:MAG TPA: hypothetical protein VIH42_12980 [Thermoguttaceae bacterium]
MKQRKPKLDSNRIPYAVVSIDKLIEIAERIVKLESEVEHLKQTAGNTESQMIELLVPHISDFRDGKVFIRAQGEDGAIYRAEVQIVGAVGVDPEY